ncbi:pleckstrin homology domain-containing family G member 5 isoform X2 [Homalodisca vitripennis]|nr:pleckstrin homology domain-containing family G member 5 isoform X2 [Homalodisca vitripennis]
MTLSAQLESLRRQKSALNKDSHGGSSQSVGTPSKPESGEFSFLRRKLAQFRSGKWKRSLDGSSMVRSQSWNHGLHTTSKLQSEWSSSLTSLQENEVVDATSTKQPQPVDKDKDRKPLTRSQSVYHKVPPPEVVKFRRSSQPLTSSKDKKRPVSYAGITQASSQFYRPLDETEVEAEAVSVERKPLAASCEKLVDDDDEFYISPLGFARHGFRRSMHCMPTSSSTQGKIFRKFGSQSDGRSRSLTHMDALEPGAVFKDVDKDSHLIVPPLQARRHKLARSQVSSSEYFSVSFEVGSNVEDDEFVVAAKGTSLAEALNSVCAKRGIDLTNVNVYLDSYKTPLPVLTTETSWLGGKHILIKGKEDRPQPTSQRPKTKVSQVSHSRKSSGYRGRGSRFFSASTEDAACTEASDTSGKSSKSSKQRWSGLFGNAKDTKMEALVDHLNNYSKHGIPQLPNADEDLEEALYNLEEDWRDVVDNSSSLPERVQQQQTAVWELIHTEVAYIHTLKVVTDLFLSCLTNLQAANILSDVDKTRLFSNITEIYSSNKLFWSTYVLPMLNASRESRSVLNPQLLLDGFIRFEEIFRPYTKYCAEQSQCQQYCRERHGESELFTAYLVWCETQKDCNRLRLMDILVKPMQRITKYSLLLKAIQKHTEADDLRLSLDQMISRVDIFVNSVNTTLRQKQDLEKLRAVISRIEAYDVVESKDEDLERLVKSYNDLDLTCPMPGCCNSQRRHLLLEGDLKIKDNVTSKMDVHCFLFTDMLLVCKATNRRSEGRFKVLRQPYLVERLIVQELNRDPATLAVVYLSEYRVPCGAFLLSSPDTKALKNWASNIKKAQDLYASAKQATTASSHSILALSRQPSGYYEDEWQEDNDVDTLSVASLGLFPLKSPRGSTRGSSLNHSHSGSVEMEGSSVSASSVSQSRGVSVENEVRGSSQSSDEGIPVIAERGYHSTSPRGDRRKCTSPNTLSIQVPVFSCLGQSLPDLNQVTATTGSSGSMLLVPPRGSPHRGTSYPPPSPPLRRAPALTLSRNPPLLKTRHIASTSTTLVTGSCEVDIPVIAGLEDQGESSGQQAQQHRQAFIKRLTRTDKRYHTAGVIEEIKKQDTRDSSIHKRLSWNCGGASNDAAHLHRPIVATPGMSTDSVRSSSGVSSTAESVSSGLNIDSDGVRELREMYHDSFACTTPPASPMSEQLTPGSSSLASSRSQLAEIILNDPTLETSDV